MFPMWSSSLLFPFAPSLYPRQEAGLLDGNHRLPCPRAPCWIHLVGSTTDQKEVEVKAFIHLLPLHGAIYRLAEYSSPVWWPISLVLVTILSFVSSGLGE